MLRNYPRIIGSSTGSARNFPTLTINPTFQDDKLSAPQNTRSCSMLVSDPINRLSARCITLLKITAIQSEVYADTWAWNSKEQMKINRKSSKIWISSQRYSFLSLIFKEPNSWNIILLTWLTKDLSPYLSLFTCFQAPFPVIIWRLFGEKSKTMLINFWKTISNQLAKKSATKSSTM